MFKLDLGKFKKIATDKHSTTMRHEDGHTMRIAHSALSPKLKSHLENIPMHKEPHMAEGGQASRDDSGVLDPYGINAKIKSTFGLEHEREAPKPQQPRKMAEGGQAKGPAFDKEGAKDFEKGVNKPTGEVLKEGWQNMKEQLGFSQPSPTPKPKPKYAEGGEQPDPIAPQPNASQMPTQDLDPSAPAQAAPAPIEAPMPPQQEQQPQIAQDPALAEKRVAYNQHILGTTPGPGNPNTMPNATFGSNGEPPKDFNPSIWRTVEDQYTAKQAVQQHGATENYNKTVQDNQVRAQAGLAPLPLPPAPASTAQTGLGLRSVDQLAMSEAPKPQQPQQPQDPYGVQAYGDAYMRGLNEQKAGLSQEAKATAELGKQQAAMLQAQVERQQQAQIQYQTHFDELDKERKAFQNDINNSHIDPNRYLGSRSTPTKILNAIGLILGGMGAGVLHQENPAMKFINDQITRDIDAQRMEIGKKENLLGANMKQFGNLRDATDMTRLMSMDMVSNQMKMAAAKAQDPMAKARLLQEVGKLDQAAAPILSQMAMRKTLVQGLKSGNMQPEKMIGMIVPAKDQTKAREELTMVKSYQNAVGDVNRAFDEMRKIGGIGGNLPFSASKARADSIKAQIVGTLRANMKGQGALSDQEIKDAVTPLLPVASDTASQLDEKYKRLSTMLSNKIAGGTPILTQYDINPLGGGAGSGVHFTPNKR